MTIQFSITNFTAQNKHMKNKTIGLLDFCLSDYFSGYFLPVLQVGVYKTMTCKEVGEAMESELNAIFDYLNPDNDNSITELWDAKIAELKAKGNAIFVEQDELEDDIECAYLYFGECQITYSNGITFLNP